MTSRMTGKTPLLSISLLANCSLVSISPRMYHHLPLRTNQLQRYCFSSYLPLSRGLYIQPPTTFLGAGNSLNGRATSSSAKSISKGKSKATEDTEAKKADETQWGTGQGRSLGSRQSNGVGTRTFGTGLTGIGGASAPRLSQRSSKKPPRRERSPTPDYGIDEDDVIVIDSDVD